MQNFISKILYSLKSAGVCRHTNALLYSDEGYCPDCGQYLKKYYYVLRCSCCDVKREARISFFLSKNPIIPAGRFCTNCGCEEFYVEKLEKLNITDVHYAIEIKEPVPESEIRLSTTQVWVESENLAPGSPVGLLPQSV